MGIIMRLNLGCGRAQLPTTKENPFTQHLRNLPESGYTADDWVNVDAAPIEGVDQVVNLFQYPWPWADNSVDEIWASHLIEHIPHHAVTQVSTMSPMSSGLYTCVKLGGWYAFFHEVHRILKPNGLFHALCPHGDSQSAKIDPTHTRFIYPGTFGYFKPNPDAPFDYCLPYEFESVHQPHLQPASGEVSNMLLNIHNEQDAGKKAAMEAEFWAWTYYKVNVFSEIYAQLRAVKDGD